MYSSTGLQAVDGKTNMLNLAPNIAPKDLLGEVLFRDKTCLEPRLAQIHQLRRHRDLTS